MAGRSQVESWFFLYAQVQARREARRVRQAQSEVDGARRALAEGREALAAAQAADRAHAERCDALEGAVREGREALGALHADPAMRDARRLSEQQAVARSAAREAEAASRRRDEASAALAAEEAEAARRRLEAERAMHRLDDELAGAARSATAARIGSAHVEALADAGLGAGARSGLQPGAGAGPETVPDAPGLVAPEPRATPALPGEGLRIALRRIAGRRREHVGRIRERLLAHDAAVAAYGRARERGSEPADDALRTAHAALSQAEGARRLAAARLDAAGRELEAANRRAVEARSALHDDAVALDLPAEAAALAGVEQALEGYRVAAGDLAHALDVSVRTEREAARQARRGAAARDSLGAREAEREERVREAEAAAVRYTTLEASVGQAVAEIDARRQVLTAREREVLENHLEAEVAATLQRLMVDAEHHAQAVNAELARRPTRTGLRFRLVWEALPEGESGAPVGLAAARERLLRRVADAWSDEDRRVVGQLLRERIAAEGAREDAGPLREQLERALHYRRWHRFRVERFQDGAWRRLSGPASSGERALGLAVPRFAAASSHYASAGHPHAPRLVLLDEAFAGVDDEARAQCMALIREFDLDFVMTSEREWGCYAELPGVAICHLVRHEGIDAVYVSRWTWDGRARERDVEPARPFGAGTPIPA